MRQMTLLTALRMPSTGFFDSAAAIVTISVPMNVNIVVSMAARTPLQPSAKKPWSVNPCSPEACEPGRMPRIASTPRTMNPTMAMTLMSANQNSNSP